MKNIYIAFLFLNQFSFAQIAKLAPGKNKPGFISITRFDTLRAAIHEQPVKHKGRLIQINIWYPSKAGTRRMQFADYVGLVGKELDTSSANKNWQQKGIDQYFEWPVSAGADKKIFTGFLNKQILMQAYSNAKWLQQTHPLVMLVHGFAADHAYLAEHLASQGYVVLQVPVKGTAAYELDYAGMGLESQVRDYEFALKILRNEFPFINDTVAAVGFSFGAQAAVAIAMRNASVKAVVSLDGGLGSFFGAQLLGNQSYYKNELVRFPILHLYNAADRHTDLNWFESIKNSNRFLAVINHVQHGHFTSFGVLNKFIPGIMGKDAADPGLAYETIMLLTSTFLDHSLKGKAKAGIHFFDDQKNSYPWIRNCVGKTTILLAGS